MGVPGEEALDLAAAMTDAAAARGASVAVTVVRPDAGPPPDEPEGGRADSQPLPGRLSGWGRGRS